MPGILLLVRRAVLRLFLVNVFEGQLEKIAKEAAAKSACRDRYPAAPRKTVTFTGASTLRSTCEKAGTTDIVTNELVKIVE